VRDDDLITVTPVVVGAKIMFVWITKKIVIEIELINKELNWNWLKKTKMKKNVQIEEEEKLEEEARWYLHQKEHAVDLFDGL